MVEEEDERKLGGWEASKKVESGRRKRWGLVILYIHLR